MTKLSNWLRFLKCTFPFKHQALIVAVFGFLMFIEWAIISGYEDRQILWQEPCIVTGTKDRVISLECGKEKHPMNINSSVSRADYLQSVIDEKPLVFHCEVSTTTIFANKRENCSLKGNEG